MASRDVAVLHLRKALSILDTNASDVAACHVQLAIDLIVGPESGCADSRSATPNAAAMTA